ncbi:hypothetical protein H4S03_001392 [Coemansia sp. S3946]|nr:hypothetical protein H4S03_001392 [Coemansia sp. S3946]
MVLVKEYRIINNCTVDEYRIAQLYAVAKMSMSETGSGEGVEVIKNEPYDNEKGKGQYTKKIYSFARQVPIFKVVTETMHLADRAETENALNLDAKVLAQRVVEHIDVTNDKELSAAAYKESEDPKLYKATKAERGPLSTEDWMETCEPVMTCYKLLTVEFGWWGFQTAVERYIHSTMRGVFALFHRQLFCDTDGWFGMTIEELRAMEDETAKKLLDKRNQELASKTEFN